MSNLVALIASIAGIIIALILGRSQVRSSEHALESTKISNDNKKLRDEIDDLRIEQQKNLNTINRYAKQIFFLRFVEESVYEELSKTNTSFSSVEVKRRIHSVIEHYVGFPYVSMDADVKKDLGFSRNIIPLNIDSYIK